MLRKQQKHLYIFRKCGRDNTKKAPQGLFQGSQVIRILYGTVFVPAHAGVAAQYIRGIRAVVLFGINPDDVFDTFCLHSVSLVLFPALLLPALLFLTLLLLALVVVLALIVVAVLTIVVLLVLVIRHVSYLPFQ